MGLCVSKFKPNNRLPGQVFIQACKIKAYRNIYTIDINIKYSLHT